MRSKKPFSSLLQVSKFSSKGTVWGLLSPASLLLVCCIAISCGVILWNAKTRLDAIRVATIQNAAVLPKFDFSSPTGYASGQRVMVLRGADIDTCHWVMNAQRMAQDLLWRIRWMPDDNAPYGREMHWSHLLLWWLVLNGWLVSLATGWPLGASIEAAALWCVVPWHLILVIALPVALRRVFGAAACSLLALGIGVGYPVASLFFAGGCDHHGIVTAFLLCGILFLVASLWNTSRTDSPVARPSRFWMIASGLFFGAGLWVSAATVFPATAGIIAGLVGLHFCPVGRRVAISSLSLWAFVIALVSLGFYLLEYFPDPFECRLEVNHPFYAMAFAGAAGFLYLLESGRPRWMIWLFIPTVAAMAFPIFLIFLFKAAVFAPSDRFLYQLHHDYIAEFQNIFVFAKKQNWDQWLVCLSPWPLAGLAALRLVFNGGVANSRKVALVCAGMAAVMLSLLACLQVRWLGTANTLWLAVLTPVAASVWCPPGERNWQLSRLESLAGGIFLLFLIVQMPQVMLREFLANRGKDLVPDSSSVAVGFARDVAYRLRALGGREPAVVASGPTTTTWLMYFGGLKGLGTLYWENAAGLKTTAALYDAKDAKEACGVIKERKIAFLVFLSPDPCENEYPRLNRGLPPGPPLEDAFAFQIVNGGGVPPWAKWVNVPVPSNLANGWATIYDVRPAWKVGKTGVP